MSAARQSPSGSGMRLDISFQHELLRLTPLKSSKHILEAQSHGSGCAHFFLLSFFVYSICTPFRITPEPDVGIGVDSID